MLRRFLALPSPSVTVFRTALLLAICIQDLLPQVSFASEDTQLLNFGPYAAVVQADDGGHLITRVTSRRVGYLKDGVYEHQLLAKANCRLLPATKFLPGVVYIDALRGSATDSGHRSNLVSYYLKVRPTRDVKEAYAVLAATSPEGKPLNLVVDLGDLKAGETRAKRYEFNVGEAFAHGQFELRLFSMGYQLLPGVERAQVATPLDKWCWGSPEKLTGDRNPEIIDFTQPGRPLGPDKQPMKGRIKLRVSIDANGYVVDAEPVDPVSGPLVHAAMDVVWLWEFVPMLKDGKPVPCTVNLPFEF